jgi:hypothetical protein
MTWNGPILSMPGFYGRVTERDGQWFGTRSGDSRVPALGPFESCETAQECVESWARSHLEWLVRTGMDQAARAQRELLS